MFMFRLHRGTRKGNALKHPVAALILFSISLASTTGTVTGRVTDGSGEPVPGATVLVEGTSFGAMADGNGEYVISRLSPGDYALTARMVGMETVSVEGVTVVSDQTTRIDFQLSEAASGVTVIEVRGQRNRILEDVPSTMHVIDRSEIETMPVASVLDVVGRQAGITTRGGEIHVRGGRGGEVDYLLDGVSVRSPMTNAMVATVPLSALAETSVATGGFGAEYGNAMSGIVRMVVREGGSDYEGSLDLGAGDMTAFGGESETRNYSEPSENSNFRGDCLDGQASLGGPEPLTGLLLPSLGVEVPGEARFFGAVEWSRSGFDLRDSRGNWDNNWQNLVSGCLNLSYRPVPSTQIGLLGRYSYRQSGWDEWAWSRYDQPAYIDGEPYIGGHIDYALPVRFEESWGLTARFSRLLGDGTVMELLADQGEFRHWRRVRDPGGGYLGDDLTPAAWYAEFYPEERVADSLGFYHGGIHPEVWLESSSSVTTGRASVTSRVGPMLEVKVGLEGKYFDIYDFSVYSGAPGQTFVSNWRASPYSGAAYLQTSFDFSGAMVLNTGLRLEAFDPSTELVEAGGEGTEEVPAKYQISPRLGMTHPVSENDVFFATYGHYFQMPSLNQMFFGTNYNLTGSYSIVGNPDLDAVRTSSYEAGVRHRFDPLSSLSFAAFSKRITGLVRTAPSSAEGGDYFFRYENDDSYATVQGVELTLSRLTGSGWSGSLGYTYSLAEGRYSSSTEQYRYSSEGYGTVPADEHYLDWDQRHTANAHLLLALDRGEGPVMGGFRPLEGAGLSLDWSWGSGFPFSPPPADSIPEVNTRRYPWTMQTDLQASRRIWAGPLTLEARATVYNLFDRRNVVDIYDPALYLDGGDPGGATSNPAAWSPARHVMFGVSAQW
ncbi:MAG: TonB-dependent receptor [Candidatus Fermentibacteraceae bacterium]